LPTLTRIRKLHQIASGLDQANQSSRIIDLHALSNVYLHVMISSQNGSGYGVVAAAGSFGFAVTCR
jgi:hypothetical protein